MGHKITVVKKIKTDGNFCRRSAQVFHELEQAKLLNKIDTIVFAQENRPESSGMTLAQQYQVQTAPFFIVEYDNGSTQIYTDYELFCQEILNCPPVDGKASEPTFNAGLDLDFFI